MFKRSVNNSDFFSAMMSALVLKSHPDYEFYRNINEGTCYGRLGDGDHQVIFYLADEDLTHGDRLQRADNRENTHRVCAVLGLSGEFRPIEVEPRYVGFREPPAGHGDQAVLSERELWS